MGRWIAQAMADAMALAMARAISDFGNELALLFGRSSGYPSVNRRVTTAVSHPQKTPGKPIPRSAPMARAMRLPMAQGTAPSGSQAKPLPSTYGGPGLRAWLMKSFMRGSLGGFGGHE